MSLSSLGNPSSWPHGKALSRKEIQTIVSQWFDAGLDPAVVEPVAQLAERSREIAVQRTQLTADVSAISRRLADGEISLTEAVGAYALEAAAQEAPTGKTSSRATILEKAARTHIERKAYRMLAFHGISLLTQHITPRYLQLREEAFDIAQRLEGIDSAGAAAKAGPDLAGQWSKLVALDSQRETLSTIAKTLAQAGVVEGDSKDDLHLSFTRLIRQPETAA